MNPRFLLDTHIVVRWLSNPRKLSRDQSRVLEDTVRRGQPLAVSAISLLEIALLGEGRQRIGVTHLFEQLDTNPVFRIIALTTHIAREVASLGGRLRDPADRAIVATARVHNLSLLTSDLRIIESDLVPVIE